MDRVPAILFANTATLLWAGNVVLGRALRTEIGPWSLACARAIVASLLFAWLLARLRSDASFRPRRREVLFLLGMGLSGVIGFQVLQYAGLRYTTAVNAALVGATGPVVALFLSRVLLGHRFRGIQLFGGLVSLAGVAVIVSNGALRTLLQLSFNPGDLLVLAAVFCWALYSVFGKILLAVRPAVWVAGFSTVLALPFLLPPTLVEARTLPPNLTPLLLLSILYIGAGPSCLAFIAWNEGVRRLGPAGAMAFLNTLPLFTVIIAALTLGEALRAEHLIGGALIIPGCLLTALCARRPG